MLPVSPNYLITWILGTLIEKNYFRLKKIQDETGGHLEFGSQTTFMMRCKEDF